MVAGHATERLFVGSKRQDDRDGLLFTGGQSRVGKLSSNYNKMMGSNILYGIAVLLRKNGTHVKLFLTVTCDVFANHMIANDFYLSRTLTFFK